MQAGAQLETCESAVMAIPANGNDQVLQFPAGGCQSEPLPLEIPEPTITLHRLVATRWSLEDENRHELWLLASKATARDGGFD